MELMKHPAMTVIYSSHQTSLAELSNLAVIAAKELYVRAADTGLVVAGPVYWIYYGMDGKPETRFTLEIALPVTGISSATEVPSSKRIPGAQYYTALHRGSWESIAGTYTDLIGRMQAEGHIMDGIFREIYVNIDLATAENNLTVVQAGLKNKES